MVALTVCPFASHFFILFNFDVRSCFSILSFIVTIFEALLLESVFPKERYVIASTVFGVVSDILITFITEKIAILR